jgi:hypothetical protein
MADKKDLFFEVMTPLGFRVRVTHAYWELIITIKHPVMAGREDGFLITAYPTEAIKEGVSVWHK